MKPFQYLEPRSLDQAYGMLARHGDKAKVIAGGQSLLTVLKSRILYVPYLINLKGLLELDHIREDDGHVRIGTLTTHNDIETSPLIRKRLPVLAEMEARLASIQIRNWGTIGGNLCHADPAGDPAPILTSLGARIRLGSARGERTVPLESFFTNYLETVLEPDEIALEIEVPRLSPSVGSAYIKESVRATDMAIASAAAVVTLNGDVVSTASIVLGAVGPTPVNAVKASQALVGHKVTDVIEQVSAIAAAEADPTSDTHGSAEYKRHLVKVLTRQVVAKATARCNGSR
ncbi:MAG: xanthine dehydrogenase family protein subunit M [Chloroflexi bacterium]|nr:xanthine dehydrogenase family protein subunit M [Chloroflexota bacterium]